MLYTGAILRVCGAFLRFRLCPIAPPWRHPVRLFRIYAHFLRIYGCILVNMRKSFANAGNLIGLGRARTLAPFFVHLKR